MKVLLIVVQHTKVVHGLYAGWRPQEKPFSVDGKGKCIWIIHSAYAEVIFLFQILCPPCTVPRTRCPPLWYIEGAFDTATFYKFIERMLDQMQPFPAPNSVIVMDNCRIHKHLDILHLIESRYVQLFSEYSSTEFLAGVCAANSYRPTLLITIQSSSCSPQWNIVFDAMDLISVLQWTCCPLRRSMQPLPKPCATSPCRMPGGGITTVDMFRSGYFCSDTST